MQPLHNKQANFAKCLYNWLDNIKQNHDDLIENIASGVLHNWEKMMDRRESQKVILNTAQVSS